MKIQNNQVRLCCGGKGCPILSKKEKGMIEITDDFGGKILIREDEAKLIKGALDQLKEVK
jgi:hypothetical protein|tara:strand:- start:7554 stop:7733 length:180 start_codon:yes stop_codon:yes gene_type:complete